MAKQYLIKIDDETVNLNVTTSGIYFDVYGRIRNNDERDRVIGSWVELA